MSTIHDIHFFPTSPLDTIYRIRSTPFCGLIDWIRFSSWVLDGIICTEFKKLNNMRLFLFPQLVCGHVFHYRCCKNVLLNKWSGPRIAFGFQQCPICKVWIVDSSTFCFQLPYFQPPTENHNLFFFQIPIEHTCLSDVLDPIRELMADVKRKALMRLEYEGDCNLKLEHAATYAMEKYAYYVCYKCNKVSRCFPIFEIMVFGITSCRTSLFYTSLQYATLCMDGNISDSRGRYFDIVFCNRTKYNSFNGLWPVILWYIDIFNLCAYAYPLRPETLYLTLLAKYKNVWTV